MKSFRRLIAVTISVAALALTSLMLIAPPASAHYSTCGAHTHESYSTNSWGQTVKTVRIHYLNCGYRATRLRPNVSNAYDPPCKTIYAGGTGYWSFTDSYYFNGGGGRYYQGLYNC